jgi:hypothetical protein
MRPDVLLEGALDIHAHGYPEFTLGLPPSVDNAAWADLAAAAKMRGYVIKSHIWPTTQIAHTLQALHPELEIYGSITLNPPAGGLSAISAELAAQTGARIVWMPTWSARQIPPKPSVYFERMKPWITSLAERPYEEVASLSAVGADGELTAEARQVIDVCARHDVTLASGHLPISESLLLARAASERSVRFVLTHPLSGSVGASLDQQQAIVELGGMIEHVFIGCMPMHQRADPRRISESVAAIGAGHCIMASDAIEGWNPPAPEVLRMFIATMLALGVSEDDVHLMTHDNPARAIGLPAHGAA